MSSERCRAVYFETTFKIIQKTNDLKYVKMIFTTLSRIQIFLVSTRRAMTKARKARVILQVERDSWSTDVQAAKVFGLVVVVRFLYYSDRPFIGTIINARPVGTSSANIVMMYIASFNDQLGDSCELTQDKIMSVHRLYISYHKAAKKGKLMVFLKIDFLNCIKSIFFNLSYVIIYSCYL